MIKKQRGGAGRGQGRKKGVSIKPEQEKKKSITFGVKRKHLDEAIKRITPIVEELNAT